MTCCTNLELLLLLNEVVAANTETHHVRSHHVGQHVGEAERRKLLVVATRCCTELLQAVELGLSLRKLCRERRVLDGSANTSVLVITSVYANERRICLTDAPARVDSGGLPGMTTKRSRRRRWLEAILKSGIRLGKRIRKTDGTSSTLACALVHDVDAMTPPVATR